MDAVATMGGPAQGERGGGGALLLPARERCAGCWSTPQAPQQRSPHLWHTKTTGRAPTPAAASLSISCATVCWKGSDSPCEKRGGNVGQSAHEPRRARFGQTPAEGRPHNRATVGGWQHVCSHLPAAGGGGVLQGEEAGLRHLAGHPGGGPAHGAIQRLARLAQRCGPGKGGREACKLGWRVAGKGEGQHTRQAPCAPGRQRARGGM